MDFLLLRAASLNEVPRFASLRIALRAIRKRTFKLNATRCAAVNSSGYMRPSSPEGP